MLHVDVHIISRQSRHAANQNISPLFSWSHIHLGLIGQFHYQALAKIEEQHTTNGNQIPESLDEQDQEFTEDLEAARHQAQLRGLPYDNCLMRENIVDNTTDNIFAVAPSEGHKPISILSDKHFEEMCNPTKYPNGKFGLISNRKTNSTLTRDRLMQMEGLQEILSTC